MTDQPDEHLSKLDQELAVLQQIKDSLNEHQELMLIIKGQSDRIVELEKALRDTLILIEEHGSQTLKAHATRLEKSYFALHHKLGE